MRAQINFSQSFIPPEPFIVTDATTATFQSGMPHSRKHLQLASEHVQCTMFTIQAQFLTQVLCSSFFRYQNFESSVHFFFSQFARLVSLVMGCKQNLRTLKYSCNSAHVLVLKRSFYNRISCWGSWRKWMNLRNMKTRAQEKRAARSLNLQLFLVQRSSCTRLLLCMRLSRRFRY